MDEISVEYNRLVGNPSDINEHLPILLKYARECDHITEMGIRYIVSSWAFLMGSPKKMVCYDILTNLNMETFNSRLNQLKSCASNIGVEFLFHQSDVLQVEIENTDLLFIDTYHEYNQIKSELGLHAGKVRKYIIFHDTTTFGQSGETFKQPNTIGIWPAIEEFLNENKNWTIVEKLENNNGLTVIKNNA